MSALGEIGAVFMVEIVKQRQVKRQTGPEYCLDEFAERYSLARQKASELFGKFGPSARELDLLMQAIQDRQGKRLALRLQP